jgi:hypothetical protein
MTELTRPDVVRLECLVETARLRGCGRGIADERGALEPVSQFPQLTTDKTDLVSNKRSIIASVLRLALTP